MHFVPATSTGRAQTNARDQCILLENIEETENQTSNSHTVKSGSLLVPPQPLNQPHSPPLPPSSPYTTRQHTPRPDHIPARKQTQNSADHPYPSRSKTVCSSFETNITPGTKRADRSRREAASCPNGSRKSLRPGFWYL
jgi:hypothetical protein